MVLDMTKFLIEAKKELWRQSLQVTPAFRTRCEELLLEKLSVLGEITEDDQLWATELVEKTFP